jgi:hypothetical protein
VTTCDEFTQSDSLLLMPITIKPPSEPLAFRVRREMLAELRALAEREETGLSTLLRRAVRLLLAEDERERRQEPAP